MAATRDKLVIFDVDGTLMHTVAIDAECFVDALARELDLTPPHTDWAGYRHTTDAGVAREIFHLRHGRQPSDDELSRLQRRFVMLLAEAAQRNPQALTPMPGAAALLAELRAGGEWDVAIATGAWRASALFKLAHGGIDITGLPAAFAEDGEGREEIVRTAWGRAQSAAGGRAYARVVAVGDAIWDVRTARALSLPFVGVAVNGAAEDTLRAAGALHVVSDFRDMRAVLRALAETE